MTSEGDRFVRAMEFGKAEPGFITFDFYGQLPTGKPFVISGARVMNVLNNPAKGWHVLIADEDQAESHVYFNMLDYWQMHSILCGGERAVTG